MNVIVDTNILVRFLVGDDEKQSESATRLFRQADEIIIPTPVFCELVWVLLSAYKLESAEVLVQIGKILASRKVVARDDEVEAGLRMMEKGGDFADGVNACCGYLMARSPAIFVSFDRQAVRLLAEQGMAAQRPE